jgi:hypothetical protein
MAQSSMAASTLPVLGIIPALPSWRNLGGTISGKRGTGAHIAETETEREEERRR